MAEARRLLGTAGDGDGVRLPALSAAELYVLCGTRQALAEHVEQIWWASLEPEAREKLTAAVLDLLIYRELLRAPREERANVPAPAPGYYPMTPALALVVAARQRPVVVAAGASAGGSTVGTPRMYGLGIDGQPPCAVVAEQITGPVREPFGPLHQFALLSPKRSGAALASWAETAAGAGPQFPGAGPSVSVYRHRNGQGLTCDTLTVAKAGDGTLLATRQPPVADASAAVSRSELADLLAEMLTGESS